MTVACDVKNIDSMLILPAGGVLTERQIDILRAWGVEEIDVQLSAEVQEEGDPLAKLTPESVAKMTAELKARFWKPDETQPAFQELFKLMLQRRARETNGQVNS